MSNTAVAPATLNNQDITALLRNSGMIEGTEGGGQYIKVEGTTFYVGDDMFVSNPKTGAPAFRAQIVAPVKQLQSRWFDYADAEAAGRPEIADSMCRSWYDEPSQNRKFSEDGTDCNKCPVNPFVKKMNLPDWADGKKCQWKGELDIRVIDPTTGTVRSDDIFTLRLSTTGMIEWQGVKDNPENGHVGQYNFMHLLARLAQEQASERGEDPKQAILKALTSLRLGGVVADIRSVPKQSADKARNYYVTQLTPVEIHDANESPALPSSDTGTVEDEDVPF